MKTLTGEQINPPEPSESIIEAIDRLRIEIERVRKEFVRAEQRRRRDCITTTHHGPSE